MNNTAAKIKNEHGNFKYRVAGVLESDNKYLFVRMGYNDFYCLPGGHIEIGEDSMSAAKRELEEELGFDVEVKQLLAIHENFYNKNGKFHEMCYYYLANPKQENFVAENFNRTEMDKDGPVDHEFKWFTANDLENQKIRPDILKEILTNKTEHIKHYITKE